METRRFSIAIEKENPSDQENPTVPRCGFLIDRNLPHALQDASFPSLQGVDFDIADLDDDLDLETKVSGHHRRNLTAIRFETPRQMNTPAEGYVWIQGKGWTWTKTET